MARETDRIGQRPFGKYPRLVHISGKRPDMRDKLCRGDFKGLNHESGLAAGEIGGKTYSLKLLILQ